MVVEKVKEKLNGKSDSGEEKGEDEKEEILDSNLDGISDEDIIELQERKFSKSMSISKALNLLIKERMEDLEYIQRRKNEINDPEAIKNIFRT